jgi:multidrug efflux pump subunit AcrB
MTTDDSKSNDPLANKFSLARWSLKMPTIVILATIVFVIWGLANYLTMSRREDPEIRIATALVITIYPGASAERVEEQVTRKLEDSIESMDSLSKLDSVSRANLSVIFVTVNYSADTDIEWQKLRSRVAEATGNMPSSIIGPDIMDNFGDTTSMIVSLQGASPTELLNITEELRAELRRVSSVGDIEIMGRWPEVVYIEGNRSEMARYGVTPYQMQQLIHMRNLQIPAGSIRTDRYQYRVEPTGAFKSIEPIKNTIIDISETTGQTVHVRDLFDVKRTLQSPPHSLLIKDDDYITAVGIVMKNGYNVVKMGADVRKVLASFEKRLPPKVRLEVVHDSPRQVDQQVSSFMTNLLEGMFIVVIAMALLLGLRSAMISATAIPLSVLIALAIMPALGIDLEMVSIGAFIVALGMLVDNSIIVADAVDIKIRQGLSPHEAAWRGTQELARPVIAGTLATVVAFVPMLLLEDEMGAYVRSLPLVVTIALLGSLVVSQTLTPLMAKLMLRPSKKPQKPIETTLVARGYRRFMQACLRSRFLIVLFAIGAMVITVFLFKAVGFSFFPDAQRDQFTIDIWLKEGTSIKETERISRLADKLLHEDPDVKNSLVYVGQGGPRFYITVMPEFQKTNYARIMVNTVNDRATQAVIKRFNKKARGRFPGARVFANKLVMGVPVEAPIAFRIIGDNLEVLRQISAKVQQILRKIPGTDQVKDTVGPDVPSLKVQINEERANRVGITNTDVALSFLATYEGFELTRFNDGEDEIPVVLRLKGDQRVIQEDMSNLPVASNITGEKVPLGSIATVIPQWGPGVIKRRNNQRTLSVLAWTNGRLANDIVLEAWPLLNQLKLPPGYRFEVAGEKEEMDDAFKQLLVVFGVIIVSLLILLVVQLGTLRKTMIVLISVPLSMVGAALGLYLGGYSFSFMVFLGVISLAGMAIKNSVVWIEYVEQSRAEGNTVNEAVILAGIFRLRPIMLTAATTVGGLLPLAMFGGVLFESMAWAMIVGLSIVTIFTLIVIPVCYSLLSKDTSTNNAQTTG